ncbi:MAG: hypothetical protein ACQEXJ_06760 [Myxococcota bacterium]
MARPARSIPLRAVVAALGVLLALPLLGAASPSAAGDDLPGCISYREDVRDRAVGYDHWVVIRNDCEQDAACEVTTDVNSDPTPATVAAGETEEVLTWRGSPARIFRATVRCTLQDAPD